MNSIAKYFLVGGCCFVIDFSIFFLMAKVGGYNYLLVNVLSFSVATSVNYALCIAFVFRSGFKHRRTTEFLLVFAVSGFSLLVNQCLLYLLVEVVRLEILFSKAVSVLLTFLVNYFGRSTLVFSQKR